MSKEKPTEKTPAPVSTPSVVSGGFQGGAPSSHHLKPKHLAVGLAAIAGLLLIGYVVYDQFDSDSPDIDMTKVNVNDIPKEYDIMTPEEVEYSLYQQTGLTVDELRNRTVDSRLLKDYQAAYVAGQALFKLNDRQKAFEAYQVAASYAGNEPTYEFALKYVEAARFAQAKSEALQMLERAKKLVANNEDLNDIDKQQEYEKLDQMIGDVRAGY